MHPLIEDFETFLDNIKLSRRSDNRINSAWGGLLAFLTGSYGIPESHVVMQGSYANGTAIRPCSADGEYDVDIVGVWVPAGMSPDEAVEDIKRRLADHGVYGAKLVRDEKKRPCARLQYAREGEGFGFHIDITPGRPSQTIGELEIPRRDEGEWKPTSPLAYTWWCGVAPDAPNQYRVTSSAMPPEFRRTVRMLKRWRDHVDDDMVKSICLQVLIGYSLAQAPTDVERIHWTLKNIQGRLRGHDTYPPQLPNPVLPQENLAARWDPGDYRRFRVELDSAVATSQEALEAASSATARSKWVEMFGEDFPASGGRGQIAPPPPPPPGQVRRQTSRHERYGRA